MTQQADARLGMRFTHHGPQYDIKEQASNFFPDQWSPGPGAAALHAGLFGDGAARAAAANRVADRSGEPDVRSARAPRSPSAPSCRTPACLPTASFRPATGSRRKTTSRTRSCSGRAIGAAYDLTGTQTLVVRGSVGVFYDRLQGDSIFGQIGNPPTGQGSTVFNSTLQQRRVGHR